jgi:hypothetical protein
MLREAAFSTKHGTVAKMNTAAIGKRPAARVACWMRWCAEGHVWANLIQRASDVGLDLT